MGPNLNFANPQSLAIGVAPSIGEQAPDMSAQSLSIQNPYDIDMGAVINEWNLSTEYVRLYTRDFKYLDDLVDGVPLNPDNDNPFVGDMTLAGLVRSIPRDSLQQLPVFSSIVNGTKNSFQALMCTFFLKKYIFNEDTFGKGLLSTAQIGGEQALSHGYAPFMVATGSMFNNYGTTLKLLHFMDNSPEPGIQDHNETGYDYVVANLTPSRVRKILKAAMNNPDTSWNVPALQQVLASTPQPTTYSIYESAARRNQPGEESGPTYQFVTRIETGPEATKITFCPLVREAPLRVIERKSKWGYPQVMYLVIDPAALTPFGISRVRLASPNQNLMNIYYGNIASMLLLNSKPPILQKGRFSTPVVLKRGAVWKAIDPQASADLKNLDNGALEQFVPMAKQFAAQIQTIMGKTITIDPSDPKAGQQNNQQPSQPDTAQNQITKIFENFLRQYALVGLDTLLSEQEGEEPVIVDDDTKNAINNLAAQKFKPTPEMPQFIPPIGDDNKIMVNWEEFYAEVEDWSVDLEVSLSKDQISDQKRSDIQDMLVVLGQNAQNVPGAAEKIDQLSNLLLEDAVPDAGGLPVAPSAAPAQMASPLPANPAVGSPNQ